MRAPAVAYSWGPDAEAMCKHGAASWTDCSPYQCDRSCRAVAMPLGI